MEPLFIGIMSVGLMVLAIVLGMHIGVALGIVSFLCFWLIKSNVWVAFSLLGATANTACMEYILIVLPMFILMGLFGNLSGASDDLYDAANTLLVRIRGGLAIATIVANAVFAAVTGSSAASAAVFSKIAYPQMKRLGYETEFSLGTIAGSSVLGMLIPPSGLLIIYGFLTETAIGKLFIAGIVPGLLLTGIYVMGIWIMVGFNPNLAGKRMERKAITSTQLILTVFKPWIFGVLIFLVLGGIYLGWFTPVEAGAVGAFGSLLFCLFRRKLTLKNLWDLLLDAGYTNASIFFLFIGAQMYARVLSLSTLPVAISSYIASLNISAFLVIVLFIIVFLALGAILDSISILLITMPIMFPIVDGLGFDPIWFGIVAIISIEMGLLTPPFGICVFIIKSSLGEEITIEQGFRGSFPFLLMMVVALVITALFPSLSTWLPGRM